jgi:YesN/AraC family two-component response regulator
MSEQRVWRVLVADDDYLVLDVIAHQIEKLGHIVVGRASDGRQAVDMAAALQPDIVLMDIQMPEMDGLEATAQIQSRDPRPVVILSAYENVDMVLNACRAGAGAYLIKPSNHRELQRTMAMAMARFEDLKELRRLNEALHSALGQVKRLSGMLPICSSCKKIRDDKGYWTQIENYIRDHSEAEFSHSLCPDCMEKLYPYYANKHRTEP